MRYAAKPLPRHPRSLNPVDQLGPADLRTIAAARWACEEMYRGLNELQKRADTEGDDFLWGVVEGLRDNCVPSALAGGLFRAVVDCLNVTGPVADLARYVLQGAGLEEWIGEEDEDEA